MIVTYWNNERVWYTMYLSFLYRSLPNEFMEEISLNITKFNIHAVVIIGGFEVSRSNLEV